MSRRRSVRVLRTFYVAGDEVGEHEVLAVLGEPGEQMPPKGSSAGPAADADDMGTTSPAYPTPAVIATQPARSAVSTAWRKRQLGAIRPRHGRESWQASSGLISPRSPAAGRWAASSLLMLSRPKIVATAEAPRSSVPRGHRQSLIRSRPLRPMSSPWFQSEAPARSRRSGCMPLGQRA